MLIMQNCNIKDSQNDWKSPNFLLEWKLKWFKKIKIRTPSSLYDMGNYNIILVATIETIEMLCIKITIILNS